ncbi:hypothetical protein GCM10010174_36500 [Kutzneria viridogrisea]|uniref:Uncharacterized protein n=2 Tax=Kutzneria TaxID=43356 RepID=A0ABR6BUV0_9PSEU|nr:hypothetical protein [Kutzneria albida]AHH94796.1 putative secreted protein [Kutzneria albida DSM 43870]MBA8930465.1 hypothetical protein [Kutzneria viridogrisea]
MASRGVLLTVACALGLLGSLAALAWGVLVLADGRELLRPVIAEFIDVQLDGTGVLNPEDFLNDAYTLFFGRATLWLGLGCFALVATVLVWLWQGWARIGLAVFAVAAIVLALRDLADLGPGLLKTLGVLSAAALLAALVLQWLPATNAQYRTKRESRSR